MYQIIFLLFLLELVLPNCPSFALSAFSSDLSVASVHLSAVKPLVSRSVLRLSSVHLLPSSLFFSLSFLFLPRCQVVKKLKRKETVCSLIRFIEQIHIVKH